MGENGWSEWMDEKSEHGDKGGWQWLVAMVAGNGEADENDDDTTKRAELSYLSTWRVYWV